MIPLSRMIFDLDYRLERLKEAGRLTFDELYIRHLLRRARRILTVLMVETDYGSRYPEEETQ